MGAATSKVGIGNSFANFVPLIDHGASGAKLKIHDGGATVKESKLLPNFVWAVEVSIDETGGDDEARDVNSILAFDGALHDGLDDAILDANVGDVMEEGPGVNDTAVQEDDVVHISIKESRFKVRSDKLL